MAGFYSKAFGKDDIQEPLVLLIREYWPKISTLYEGIYYLKCINFKARFTIWDYTDVKFMSLSLYYLVAVKRL